MKNKIRFLIAVPSILILFSCSSSKLVNKDSIKGYFSYLADAALFTDCKTNKKYPVLMEKDYLKLERAYLDADKNPGENILVEIVAEIQTRPKIEGEGEREFILVMEFINIFPNEKCN